MAVRCCSDFDLPQALTDITDPVVGFGQPSSIPFVALSVGRDPAVEREHLFQQRLGLFGRYRSDGRYVLCLRGFDELI